MKKIGLKEQIFIGMMIVSLLSGVLMFVLFNRSLDKHVKDGLIQQGESVAQTVCAEAVPLVLEQNVMGVSELCSAVKVKNVAYIYITNSGDELLASSLGNKFPEGLERTNIPKNDKTSVAAVKVLGKDIYDVAVVMEGDLGVVHVGLNVRSLSEIKKGLLKIVLITILMMLSFTGLLALLLGYIITKPLRKITYYINDISEGKFSSEVDVISSGELGELVSALERLQAKLEVKNEKVNT